MSRVVRRLALAALAAVAVTATGFGVASAGDDDHVLGPGTATVRVDIEHSRFSVDRIVVREGTLVTFVVHNGDPINHELVVGDDGVHARHARGTEPFHPPVPGEVSVGPGETARTVYLFDDPDTMQFACHLPRHVEYGMVGELVVVPIG